MHLHFFRRIVHKFTIKTHSFVYHHTHTLAEVWIYIIHIRKTEIEIILS